MTRIKFDNMKHTWYEIAKYSDGSIPPNFEMEMYKRIVNLFHVGEYYFYIFHLPNLEMDFVSDSMKTILGLNVPEFSVQYIFENIHPDDKNRFIAHEKKVTKFFTQLPPEKVMKYKVSYDYRLKCNDGSYKWILQQVTTIQTDKTGAVIRVLGVHTDVTHLKTDNQPSGLSFIGLDGEPSFFNVELDNLAFLPSVQLFTKREKEVLTLIVEGKTSQEIADQLNTSIHTVHTHRKNILRKATCTSPTELVSKAIQNGWV